MTSSVLNEEQLTLMKPDEGIMTRRGEGVNAPRDMNQLRTELAPVQEIDSGTRYVEEGSATFINHESDMPTGPSGIGETVGNVDLVRVVGGRQQLQRYTHGFTVDIEDEEVSNSWVTEARDAILTLFDLEADRVFYKGLDAEDGTTVVKGVFNWLEDNMPSSNIINCADFDPSSGDLGGVPANIVKKEAYSYTEGIYANNQWDVAVAKPPVWAYWNELGTFEGATIESQWEMIAAEDDADVGVDRRFNLPNDIGIPHAPGEDSSLTFDVDLPTRTNTTYTSPLASRSDYEASDDAMYLIPDHGGDFYELYEEGSPEVRGPLEKEGWRERFEYKWTAGVVQGQNGHLTDTDKARDVIKLENVTALFDNA